MGFKSGLHSQHSHYVSRKPTDFEQLVAMKAIIALLLCTAGTVLAQYQRPTCENGCKRFSCPPNARVSTCPTMSSNR
jgi:hypothetical protein